MNERTSERSIWRKKQKKFSFHVFSRAIHGIYRIAACESEYARICELIVSNETLDAWVWVWACVRSITRTRKRPNTMRFHAASSSTRFSEFEFFTTCATQRQTDCVCVCEHEFSTTARWRRNPQEREYRIDSTFASKSTKHVFFFFVNWKRNADFARAHQSWVLLLCWAKDCWSRELLCIATHTHTHLRAVFVKKKEIVNVIAAKVFVSTTTTAAVRYRSSMEIHRSMIHFQSGSHTSCRMSLSPRGALFVSSAHHNDASINANGWRSLYGQPLGIIRSTSWWHGPRQQASGMHTRIPRRCFYAQQKKNWITQCANCAICLLSVVFFAVRGTSRMDVRGKEFPKWIVCFARLIYDKRNKWSRKTAKTPSLIARHMYGEHTRDLSESLWPSEIEHISKRMRSFTTLPQHLRVAPTSSPVLTFLEWAWLVVALNGPLAKQPSLASTYNFDEASTNIGPSAMKWKRVEKEI